MRKEGQIVVSSSSEACYQ